MCPIFSHLAYILIEVIKMKLEFNEYQQLIILSGLQVNYMDAKIFFKEANNKEECEGMITPNQYVNLYNMILQKAHEEGHFKALSLIEYN